MCMKTLLYVLFIVTALSCSCGRDPSIGSSFPDKKLEEVIIYGYYQYKNPNRLEDFKKEVVRQSRLKSGEAFREKYPEFLNIGDENFRYSFIEYCYNKSVSSKESIFKGNFKVRLYDKENNLLAEDSLRLKSDDKDSSFVMAYLPYHNAGHEIRVIKIVEGKEIILRITALEAHAELVAPRFHKAEEWDVKKQCHRVYLNPR